MKNFFLLCLQIGIGIFALVGVLSLLNNLFGLSLGFSGNEVPADLVFAIVMLVCSGISAGHFFLFSKKG